MLFKVVALLAFVLAVLAANPRDSIDELELAVQGIFKSLSFILFIILNMSH
jgi:hypothetical protein